MDTPELPLFSLAHASDIHFGAIDDLRVVEALVADINAAAVDLVCVSGDLTQRARDREFSAARDMLGAFSAPHLVVPGNHDVYQWWNPFKRVFKPLRRYRREISADLAPTFEKGHDGASLAALGINSAHGRTRKGGRISSAMRAAMQAFFAPKPPGTFKVLVLHHHLTRLRALGHHDVSRKATRTLALAQTLGVDLILCGHLHISHVEAFGTGVPPDAPVPKAPDAPIPGAVETSGSRARRVVIASAGTATSSRGRGKHRLTNFYNRIYVYADRFEIVERRFDTVAGAFVTTETRAFDRV